MKQKIFFLLSSIFFLLINCAPPSVLKIPYYSTYQTLYQDTKNRPDLMALYLQHNPHLWTNNMRIKLILSQKLTIIGKYSHSLQLNHELLAERLSFYYQGQNYINIALNYSALQKFSYARFYFEKAIKQQNIYYYFLYARMEEYQTNYPKSIDLYQYALGKYEKLYIQKAYARTLYKSLIHFKKKDPILYYKYLSISKNNLYMRQSRIKIIHNGMKI